MERNVWSKMIIIILLAAVSACGPTLAERKKQADAQYQLGVAELNQNNIQGALQAFEKARAISPDDPNIHYAFGLVYYRQEKYLEAITEYKKALKLNPNFSDAHNNLGATYARLKKWDEAIVEYKNALSDPFYRTPQLAHYNCGFALMEKGDLIEAVKEFHAAVRIQPNFSQAFNKYGVSLFRLNRIQEAIKQFHQAIKVEPDYMEPYLNLGLAYMKQGNKDEAIAQFKYILEHSSDEELRESAERYLEILE